MSGRKTTVDRLNPEGVHRTPGYHHVTTVSAGRTAYLSGQCPLDRSGAVVAGGFTGQTDQVVANALTVLAAVDAEPDQVVRAVVYVASPNREDLAAVWRRLTESTLAPAFTAAATLLGVAQLGYEGQLVEVDLTVALD